MKTFFFAQNFLRSQKTKNFLTWQYCFFDLRRSYAFKVFLKVAYLGWGIKNQKPWVILLPDYLRDEMSVVVIVGRQATEFLNCL